MRKLILSALLTAGVGLSATAQGELDVPSGILANPLKPNYIIVITAVYALIPIIIGLMKWTKENDTYQIYKSVFWNTWGMLLWECFLVATFYIAVRYMPLERRQKIFMFWFCAHDRLRHLVCHCSLKAWTLGSGSAHLRIHLHLALHKRHFLPTHHLETAARALRLEGSANSYHLVLPDLRDEHQRLQECEPGRKKNPDGNRSFPSGFDLSLVDRFSANRPS